MANSWIVVPNLNELVAQMNARFPKRDKASDGAIGNTSHQARASSHNPDRFGSPEHRDGDSLNEVRARDIDKDLNSDDGVTMEQIVQHWIKNARDGKLWWIRYIIFDGRIWHKRDNYVTRNYTGANKHEKHVHVNSDFTQAADSVTNTDWLLKDFGKKPVTPKPKPIVPKPIVPKSDLELTKKIQSAVEVVPDGKWGNITDGRTQLMRTAAQATVGAPVRVIRKFDVRFVQAIIDTPVDGDWGPKSLAAMVVWTKHFQKVLGVTADGAWGPKTDKAYTTARERNHNKF